MNTPPPSEQTPAQAALETSLIDLLYDLDDGPVEDFFIGQTSYSDISGDRGTDDVTHAIDALCEVLDIAPHKWAARFRRGTVTNISEGSIKPRTVKRAERHGASIGRFMTDIALEALPIEWGVDGEGEVEIELGNESGLRVVLRSNGDHWTNYTEETDEEGEFLEQSDSVLEWKIGFSAAITPPDSNSGIAGEEISN